VNAPAETADLPADPVALLALARPIAETVATRLEVSLGRELRITAKSTATDLVTEMDQWAEAHITEALLAARPDDSVLGEEGVDHVGTSGVSWSIDPIDGTINFIHGLPSFCVSIAAVVEGLSVAGVVASPLHREVFTAALGSGAFCNDEPIACATPLSLARSVVGTGFGYDPARRRRQAEVLVRVIDQIADVRRSGSAALDLCRVACGRLDAYWEVGLNPWDLAAGSLIATEAGARCEGFDGGPPDHRGTICAPENTFGAFAALLHEADAPDV
jgi:myo-inositol-1(or 4)-monophosphatase